MNININNESFFTFLDNYDDISNNNFVKNTIFTSVFKKILSTQNNVYSKIQFLEKVVAHKNLKLTLFNIVKNNYTQTKLFLIKSILFSENNNTLLLERYTNVICELFDNNYYYFQNYFLKALKTLVGELHEKSQHISIETPEDLKTKFNKTHIFSNLTDFSIMLFDRIERKKYELCLKNKEAICFDTIFKIIVRLLEFGYINYIEELNVRMIERDDYILDIIYYETLILKMKEDIENNENYLPTLLEDKMQLLKTNEKLVEEYKEQNKLILKRIEIVRNSVNFCSKYIHDFINWLVTAVNFKITHNQFVEEKLFNIILTYKNNLKFDIFDRDESLLMFIYNINTVKNIKNHSILIKSINLLKQKYYEFKVNKYKASMYNSNKFWIRVMIDTTLRLKKNKYFIYNNLSFICTIINGILKKNKNISIFLEHIYKKNEIKIFIHYVLRLFKKSLKEIITIYIELFQEKKSLIESILYTDKYMEYLEYYKSLKIINKLLLNIVEDNAHLLFCYENRNLYLEILDSYVNEIITLKETFISNETFYSINKMLNILIEDTLKNHLESFISIYSVEFIEFKKKSWINYIHFMDNLNFVNFNIKLGFAHLNKSLLDFIELSINSNKDIFIKLEDKFSDPITSTCIESPIVLSNDIIVDRYIIYKHLIENEYNPFNRDYLTIPMLEQFNCKHDTIQRLNSFNHELRVQIDKFK